MRPKVVLNSREVRLYVTAIVGVSILLLIGSSSAFAQASAEPLTLQSTTNVGDQNKQLADQINQLQQEIVRLQADIDLTGVGKKTSLKSEMKISPAPKKGMGMMAGDKSKMGMPPAKAPMRSDSTAIGMKDDQGEMAGMSPAVNSSMSPTSPATATTGGMSGSPPETAAAGGMGVMGEIMTAPRKEIYPSLMALPDEASPEMRAGIEQVAIERMK